MTTLADSTDFSKVHKKQRTYQVCPPALIAKYRGRLPDVLVNTWEASGFQSFSDGFLWTVNPDALRDVAAEFKNQFETEHIDVMFRTAFGDLIVSHKGKLYHLSAVTMLSDALPDRLESVLDLHFGQKMFLDSIFFFNLFKKGLKRLGAPEEDEVYALVPAPAIGGEITADHLQKAKLRVYLNYLAQLSSNG
jgi:hypothetical protein